MYLSDKQIKYNIQHHKNNLNISGKLLTYDDSTIVNVWGNVYFGEKREWIGHFYVNENEQIIDGDKDIVNKVIHEILYELNELGYAFRY